MGAIAKPIGGLFGVGSGAEDDPTYQPDKGRLDKYNDFADNFDTNYGQAMGAADSQMRGGDITKGLFGAGGLNDRLGAEEQQLASQGFQLKPEDREAYGQASGDISRQFGQQEQDTSKMLARRGLGGGSSGAAGAAFSGLAGNKNEMLAKAQTAIAQKRMQDTQQRLQQTRSQMQSLGLGGQQMANQMTGDRFKAKEGGLAKASGLQSTFDEQGRQANEDAIGHKAKNIGDAWSEGTYSGTKSGTADATSSWMSMGGAGSMMSDEDNKTGITDGAPAARGFLKQISNSHDYSLVPPKGGDKKSGAGGQQSPGPQGAPWGKFLEQPKKDGSYTASAGESARMERASSGLAPSQNGSGGMNAGGATENSGLTSLFNGGGPSSGGGSGGMPELMSMFSDEACKQNVRGGEGDIRGFLDSVAPHSYEYKDEFKDDAMAGEGEFVSPMAQELEQTELGADMVEDTPDGKVVDYGKGFGTLLAGMADVNKRLSAIEGRKK